jgi:hypothetical protein
MKKKIILFTSLALVIMFSILILFVDILNYDFCSRDCINIGESFFFFPLVFFFSLITYFTPDRIFQSWWKFARIAIPLIFTPILLINLEVHHSKNGQWQDIFDLQILILLYSIFTIGSIWAIWKGWRSK